MRGEYRTRLERQLVMREMRGRERECLIHIAQRRGQILPGQRVHEIEVEVAKSRGVQLLGRAARLLRGVNATERT